MIAITQPWPTKDGRWVLPHFGLPNLQARMLKLLGCEPTPQSVASAVAKWDALDLEAAIDEARLYAGDGSCRMRSGFGMRMAKCWRLSQLSRSSSSARVIQNHCREMAVR